MADLEALRDRIAHLNELADQANAVIGEYAKAFQDAGVEAWIPFDEYCDYAANETFTRELGFARLDGNKFWLVIRATDEDGVPEVSRLFTADRLTRIKAVRHMPELAKAVDAQLAELIRQV